MTDGEFDNLVVNNELLLPCYDPDTPKLTNQQIIERIYRWIFEDNEWKFKPLPFDIGPSYQRFRGEYEDPVTHEIKNQYLNLFLILSTENEFAPLLVTDQGFIVKKDIAAGGYVGSNQGVLMLGHGLTSPTEPPKIILMHSEEEYGWQDTLYLKKLGGSEPAHMNLGKLTATGGAKLNAIAIGKDEYGDIPYEYESIQLNTANNLRFCFGTNERMVLSNAGRLELPVQGSSGGLKIGGDVSLYRQSAAVLRIASNVIMDGPSFTIDHSVDNPTINLKKAGAERVMLGHNGGETVLSSRVGPLILNSPTNIGIDIAGAYITVYGSKNFVPSNNNQGNIGGNGIASPYWGSGWFNYLRYKNLSSFEALDDLALVKQYKTKSIVEDDVEREVVDLETLPFVKADGADFVDSGKVNGFLLGCVKKLVLRVEKLEAELKNLENSKGRGMLD